jgi:hypothetical protein
MKIHLSEKQEKFLQSTIELYDKWPDIKFPRNRIKNILRRGYYYDDMSSDGSIPYRGDRTDKEILNEVSKLLKAYYKKCRIYNANNHEKA